MHCVALRVSPQMPHYSDDMLERNSLLGTDKSIELDWRTKEAITIASSWPGREEESIDLNQTRPTMILLANENGTFSEERAKHSEALLFVLF